MRTAKLTVSLFLYVCGYAYFVFFGRHLKLRVPLKHFRKRINVGLHVCADARYHGVGAVFFQWFRANEIRGKLGMVPTFYVSAVPGPSVSELEDPRLFETHINAAVATACVGKVQRVELHGHFDCARDPAHSPEEMERVRRSMRALRRRVHKELKGVPVFAYVDHPMTFGWSCEELDGENQEVTAKEPESVYV